MLNSQEIALLKDLIEKCITDEFCDNTTKKVALSILNKLNNDQEI